MRKTANLAARKDNLRNLEETFRYDELYRLVGVRLNGGNHDGIKYDAYGRMASKQAYGQTVFEGAQYETYDHAGRLKPHAMSGATMALRPFSTDNQDITYTMFDKVKTISQSGNGPRMSLSYTYGHDRQRIHMEEKIGDYTLREKRYGDHCEIMTENRYTVSRTFLSGPLGVFAVVEHHGDGDELHYVYKDHLGNWTTITDGAGNVEREQSFDAWGNPRDAETWSGGYNGPLMFDRGFTGHEHLTSFGLINMNGRMYDPVMSTFLSPDNYIQSPDYSQSFNRYAYCMNNPLKYTDPSGWVMVGGMKPMPWSTPLQRPVHGPSTLTNAYNLVNLAFYGNLYGPDFAGGAGGSGCSGGAVSMSDLQGTYGYYAAYQANSVHNYTFPSAQLQLIRNWHNNPSHSTNSDVREAGITNVSVGTLHGQLDGKDGYRNSYYHWTDNSGKARFAAVCLEYVGGNSKGTSVLSLQPLGWYGEGNMLLSGMLNVGGIYSMIGSKLYYNETLGFWRGRNGQFQGLHFNGNRYTGGRLKYGKAMSNHFRMVSSLFNTAGMMVSASQCYAAESIDDKIQYGADVIIGGIGFMPGGGGISTFWFLGGRELVFQYGNTMVEMMNNGINPGYLVYQPFK